MAFTYRNVVNRELEFAEIDENFFLVETFWDQLNDFAAIAAASTNFRGVWNSITGALQVPTSVYWSGRYWMLLSNIPNNPSYEPGVASQWAELPNVQGPASATDNAVATFDGASGKRIKNNAGLKVANGFDIQIGGSYVSDLGSNAHYISLNGALLSANGPNGFRMSSNEAGTWAAPVRASAAGASRYWQSAGSHYWSGVVSGAAGTSTAGLATPLVQVTEAGRLNSLYHLMGYGAGAGGSVVQATSKSTAVTLNKPSGTIKTHAAALAAGASVVFHVNNVFYATNVVVVLTPFYGATGPNSYRIEPTVTAAGGFAIRITNITAGSLSEAIDINFALFSSSTS